MHTLCLERMFLSVIESQQIRTGSWSEEGECSQEAERLEPICKEEVVSE